MSRDFTEVWYRNHNLHKTQSNTSSPNSETCSGSALGAISEVMSDWNRADYECLQATVSGLNWMRCQSEKHTLSHMAHQITVFGLFPHLSRPLGWGVADNQRKSDHFAQMCVSQIKWRGLYKDHSPCIILFRHYLWETRGSWCSSRLWAPRLWFWL